MGVLTTIRRVLPPSLQSVLRQVYYQTRTLLYKGNQYQCPVCSTGLRKFRPTTGSQEENLQCPRCGSQERHRLLWLYLKRQTDFFTNPLKVLDFAPVDYLQRAFKRQPDLDYTSVDVASPLAMVKMDITDLQFPDNNFDCILCYHVLEHVVDDRKALRELYRVLKPGGWSILQVPIDRTRETTMEDPAVTTPEERERVYGQSDHVRIYGKDYPGRLEQAGFEVTGDEFVRSLGPEKTIRFCLTPDEILYICRKI